MSRMQRIQEIAKLEANRKNIVARLNKYQEDLDWITEMNNAQNATEDNGTEIQAWAAKAERKIKEKYPQQRAKLSYSYTMEITTEKANDAGNLETRTYDITMHEKTSSGAKSIAANIKSHLEDYIMKPYVKNLKLKNVEILDIPYQTLDLSLQPMFQASPLMVYDHMKLNCNFKEIDACVPLTLFDLFAWKEGDVKTSKKLKIDMQDILIALNQEMEIDWVLENETYLMTKGYNAQEVLGFCQRFRIKTVALDHCDRVINKHNTNCNVHLPALAYVCANNHMYLLDDDKVRKTILPLPLLIECAIGNPPR